MEVVPLPVRAKKSEIVKAVETMLRDAQDGKISGLIVIKFQPEGKFAIRKVGNLSDLEMCGALDFAKYDIMSMNTPKYEGK